MDGQSVNGQQRGRPPRLPDPSLVKSPLNYIQWLVRVHRLLHPEAEMAKSGPFAARLSQCLGRTMSAGRITKFESPRESSKKPLTLAVMAGYEQALGLAPGTITLLYAHLRRNHRLTSARSAGQVTGESFDLIEIASHDSPLSVAQWEVVAGLYQAPGCIRSGRTRRRISEYLVSELNRSIGADAIRMREVTLRMADADVDELHSAVGRGRQWLIPALVDSVRQEPAGAYAAMEVLGFTDPAHSVGIVTRTLTTPPDPWIVRAALETYTRFVDPGSGPHVRDGGVRRLALTLLRDEAVTYTVRHQAARLLDLVAPGDEQVKQVINGVGDLDVRYAYLLPSAKVERRRSFIVAGLSSDIQQQVRDLKQDDGVLAKVLWKSLFSRDRADRHEAAWLLQASPYAAAAAAALGRLLADPSADLPYEYQRAMAVVLGKLAHPSAISTMQAVLDDAGREPTVHVSAAFFLADLPATVEAAWLVRAYTRHYPRPDVLRGLVVVAVKDGNQALLLRAASDPVSGVARYARHWPINR